MSTPQTTIAPVQDSVENLRTPTTGSRWPITTPEGLEHPLSADHPERVVRLVASVLDYPSVYMGGPSHHSRRVAVRVLEALESEGLMSTEATS